LELWPVAGSRCVKVSIIVVVVEAERRRKKKGEK
jgi:hypothetical protein